MIVCNLCQSCTAAWRLLHANGEFADLMDPDGVSLRQYFGSAWVNGGKQMSGEYLLL